MRRFILFFSLIIFSVYSVKAQSPKREFRAAWIASVANIDWPSKPGLPSIQQQEQFIHLLDELKSIGCNAVIVQIRPSADALYASSIEPWSHYLTGRQGQPPFPYYDPLKFMIQETHSRNMEFHAWFNPFRALVDNRKNLNPASHVTKKHPDWIINYGDKAYINPGIPEAREYVISVIMDVVKRYDIDGVHLDDYFYPYRIAGKEFGDQKSYAQYNGGMNKEDWRRNNINLFISLLNANIKSVKPYVKFGISPFGIWRNASKDPRGSLTRGGQTDYDDLYADVLLWMQKGWIDYLMPQLYWEHGNHAAAFDVLLPWWNANGYGRHIYYGLGLYRMVNTHSSIWSKPSEILWQIHDIRQQSTTPGYCFFSASNFYKLPAVQDSLSRSYNKYPAMPPVMKWLDSIPPVSPVLKAIPSVEGTLLQWKESNPHNETIRFAVYRFINDEPVNLNRADKIISIQSIPEFLDMSANKYNKCTYVVTALDRLWNESAPSNMAVTNRNE